MVAGVFEINDDGPHPKNSFSSSMLESLDPKR
jgi:hypothetical protein